jgi:two-component system NarL family sensor kinase
VTDGWPDDRHTSADALLFRTARELLANVAEHARARTATVILEPAGPRARLIVADDGVGLPEDSVERSLRDGHIGPASHAVRIDAAGGSLTTLPGEPSGRVVVVELPCVPDAAVPDPAPVGGAPVPAAG